jgi:hypothetical protein
VLLPPDESSDATDNDNAHINRDDSGRSGIGNGQRRSR